MSRKRKATRRETALDPTFSSEVVTRFVNRMMHDGKKSISQSIFYEAMDKLSQKADMPALEVFTTALEKVKPLVEVRSRRVGGSTYQVPVEVREERREALAMRWLISFARKRGGKTMSDKLSSELFDAFNSTGSAFKKKEDVHRMAEANKAFSHYRW